MNKNGKHTSSCKANRMFNRGLGKFYEKKVEEGTYKDGKFVGLWTSWNENGEKWREETYKDGKLISSICWDDDGNEKGCN